MNAEESKDKKNSRNKSRKKDARDLQGRKCLLITIFIDLLFQNSQKSRRRMH